VIARLHSMLKRLSPRVRLVAIAVAYAYNRRARSRIPSASLPAASTLPPRSQPATWSIMPSKVMFSSCSPCSALVAGVKIGSGRRSLSRRPEGNAIPQTVPLAWYSFQPDPAR
jgi:hypothetical protein